MSLTADIQKNKKSQMQPHDSVSSFCLIGHMKCVSLTLIACQLKSWGQGLGVTLGFQKWVRLKLDRTGWDKWTLALLGAVNTCLSFPWVQGHSLPQQHVSAHVATSQFHLDGGQSRQNELDLPSCELLLHWLRDCRVCTACYVRICISIKTR